LSVFVKEYLSDRKKKKQRRSTAAAEMQQQQEQSKSTTQEVKHKSNKVLPIIQSTQDQQEKRDAAAEKAWSIN
jgi:hypothetical protein